MLPNMCCNFCFDTNSHSILISRKNKFFRECGRTLPIMKLVITSIVIQLEDPNTMALMPNQAISFKVFGESDAREASILGRAGKASINKKTWYNIEYKKPDIMKGKKISIDLKTVQNLNKWKMWVEQRNDVRRHRHNTRMTTVASKLHISTIEDLKRVNKIIRKVQAEQLYCGMSYYMINMMLIKHVKNEVINLNFIDRIQNQSQQLLNCQTFSSECYYTTKTEGGGILKFFIKIEVKLQKRDSIRWNSLEGDGAAPSIKVANLAGPVSSAPTAYPSSHTKKHDWNKLEAMMKEEEENEKLEGDAALNQLFQKIYSQGNEETRRAMNKSFVESGGTVLSTNWNEVAPEKVEVKPPDGMEHKTW
ncbi:unnamed protein product, partial [Meganyctiphanes norvegica]